VSYREVMVVVGWGVEKGRRMCTCLSVRGGGGEHRMIRIRGFQEKWEGTTV
jgi:hypothetical protein